MGTALYDGFIADYYDESPIVRGRVGDVAFYRCGARIWRSGSRIGVRNGADHFGAGGGGASSYGLDISERMLQRCNQKRAKLRTEARERVHLVQGDMTRFDLGEKFRLVIIPFRPMQHLLEIDAQISCLESVRRHLSENGERFGERRGRLILDVFQTDAERMHDPAYQEEGLVAEYSMPDGRRVRIMERVTAFHRAQQRNDVEMIFT